MNVAPTDTRERSYRPDIDGIRAFAILSVVCFHANVPLFTGGFTGVDVFFVLSGYLIGGHIFSELQSGSFSFLRFYQRRAKRILPAFYFVLAFLLAVSLVLTSSLAMFQVARSAFMATLSVSNIYFWKTAGYFAPGSESNPLLMTWSLGVEEQFYAVIPLLMVLLARLRRSWILPSILLVCVFSFLFACLALRDDPDLVFYLLPARAWELGVGVALAVFELSRRNDLPTASAPPRLGRGWAPVLSVAGLAAILAPMFLLGKATPFPGAAALPSVLGTAMLLAAPQSWINRRLLSLPPLVYIGRVSYSWYLWHWPLLAFVRVVYGSTVPPLAVTLAAVGLAFAAAVLSYYVIEQPFRRSRRAPAPLLVRYAAVTLVLLALCGVLDKTRGFAWRYSELTAMEADTQALLHDSCLVSAGSDQPNLSAHCYDRSPARPALALWGDSHSGAMALGLRPFAARSGFGFVQMSKTDCLPLIGAVRYSPTEPQESPECLRFNQNALGLLAADPHIRVVVLCGFWSTALRLGESGVAPKTWLVDDLARENDVPTLPESRRIFIQSLAALIAPLQTAGKQVIVFEDTPSFGFDPIWRVDTARIPARRTLAAWFRVPDADDPGIAPPEFAASDNLAAAYIQQTVLSLPAKVPTPQFADLRHAMCAGPNQCVYRDGDRILFSDTHHVTADGAEFALRDFHLPPPANGNP